MKDINKVVLSLAAIVMFGILLLSAKIQTVNSADNVCFCHNLINNPVTICTDNQGQINGHQGHVDNGSDTLGSCPEVSPTPTVTPSPTPSVTPTATPSVTPTPTPIVECDDEEQCPEPTVTPTVTPTPTTPPNTGGPGDGLSDGKSDGRSSCPECTKAPIGGSVLGATTEGQVLGATTDFAATGTTIDMLMNLLGSAGALSVATGMTMIAKKRSSK